MSKEKAFFEEFFSSLTHGDMEKFFSHIDPDVKWTLYGDHPIAGFYHGVHALKSGFREMTSCFQSDRKFGLRYLVVEGKRAMAFVYDSGTKLDGSPHQNDFCYYLQLNDEGDKITEADLFCDSMMVNSLFNAAKGKGYGKK